MKIFNYVKKNIISYLAFALSTTIFCTLIFVAYGKFGSASRWMTQKTVIIDAGHGGEDGGAVGVDGIVEKDINLEISLGLRDLLEISGYQVIMTRDKDEAIYDSDCDSLRQKKRSDLKNRAKIIENNAGADNIFVSIHQNKFPDSKYFGTQIFYSKNDSKSALLATAIKESVVRLLQPKNTREIKPADKKIFLLSSSKIPSVVVECGFLSNPEEAKKLSSKEYRSKIVFCVYCGIVNYFLNNS